MKNTLIDRQNRIIDYFRVSITDLCNLRCVYCRPPSGVKLVSHEDILRYEEILTIISSARDLGIKKIRITGGEPLVRRGVVGFIEKLASLSGIEDIGLTTNAVFLADMAKDLKSAGLKRVNISLDSLNRDVLKNITGFDCLERVLAGIDAAFDNGFNPVKINTVLLKGINERDIADFAAMTLKYPVDVRFIERMPFGADHIPNSPESFSAEQALNFIEAKFGNLVALDKASMSGPATMFRIANALGNIGIIDPVTGHFCGTCNRLRLTARGTLRPCLLSPHEIDIKTPLRNGATSHELAAIIVKAVAAKPLGREQHNSSLHDGMNTIGG